MAAAIASTSSGARPALAKLPTPNTRVNRSRTRLQSAGAQDDLDAPHEHAYRFHVEVGQRRAQIAHQPRHEPRAVLTFESDFLVVDYYGLHLHLDF